MARESIRTFDILVAVTLEEKIVQQSIWIHFKPRNFCFYNTNCKSISFKDVFTSIWKTVCKLLSWRFCKFKRAFYEHWKKFFLFSHDQSLGNLKYWQFPIGRRNTFCNHNMNEGSKLRTIWHVHFGEYWDTAFNDQWNVNKKPGWKVVAQTREYFTMEKKKSPSCQVLPQQA